MVILNTGLNAIRDLVAEAIDKGEMGTNGTAAVATDTGLGTADSSTIKSITKTKADKQITYSYFLATTEGTNPGTYKEIVLYDNGTANYDRIVIPSINKTTSKSISVVKRHFFKSG